MIWAVIWVGVQSLEGLTYVGFLAYHIEGRHQLAHGTLRIRTYFQSPGNSEVM